MGDRPLETVITLVLEHVDPELSRAHRELYQERIAENIPFSLTLLYPWVPAPSVTEDDLADLRSFFSARPRLEFDLTEVKEFPGTVAYAAPARDAELRATMKALWTKYPQYPPYGEPRNEPPPHATLGRYAGETPITFEQAKERVEPLLPVHCVVEEATLLQEHEPDRLHVRAAFPFGDQTILNTTGDGAAPEEHPDQRIEDAALAAYRLIALPGAGYREAAQTLKALGRNRPLG